MLLRSLWLFTSLLLLALPLAAQNQSAKPDAETSARAARRWPVDVLRETFGFTEQTPGEVRLDDLIQGCPARDCIPALNAPKYVSADAADFLLDDDLVLGVEVHGQHYAFPTLILARHEIVNDILGGEPVAVTYCPLCGSGVAFSRRVGEQVLEFGVSGVLHNNDLVMYDRSSNTLWQQITGRGILGPRTGETLQTIPVTQIEWKTWREQHPDTRVLSTDTGYDVRYTRNPYGDYPTSERVLFPLANLDRRIHPKMVVYGLEYAGKSIALTDEYLQAHQRVEAELADTRLIIERGADGSVSARTPEGTIVPTIRLYWFAWASFHPDTELRALARP